jgi:hypothetical protein
LNPIKILLIDPKKDLVKKVALPRWDWEKTTLMGEVKPAGVFLAQNLVTQPALAKKGRICSIKAGVSHSIFFEPKNS